MSVFSVPAPTSGPSPFVMPETAGSAPPRPGLTPNPYGIPDSIVLDSARSAHDGPYDALGDFFKASIGDDLTAASDGKQTPQSRLLHAGLAAATVLTLPAAPELFGLKLAAKQTIKGGIEQLTFHAVGDAAAKGGKLILHDGAQLNPAESKIASMYVARGQEVIAQSTSRIEGQRTADFLIDGNPTELKTMSNARANAAGDALTKLIVDATKQAPHVIVDATSQRGLTHSQVKAAVENALRDVSRQKLKSIHVLGKDGANAFEVTVNRR